jgi:hypothetical protein
LAVAEGDPHAAEDDRGLATKTHRASKFADWLVRTFGVEKLSEGSGVLDVAGGRGDVSWELHTVRGVPCTLVEPRARKLNRLQHKWLKKREMGVGNAVTDDTAEPRPPRGGDGDDDDDDDDDENAADAVLCPQVRAEFGADTYARFAKCSVVVGMHPDQATEGIMAFAKAHGKPFAIVPCCVFPALFPHRRVPADEAAGAETPAGVSSGGVPVTRLAQLVRYLERETGGRVTRLDFQGANRVVYSTEPPRGFRVSEALAGDD